MTSKDFLEKLDLKIFSKFSLYLAVLGGSSLLCVGFLQLRCVGLLIAVASLAEEHGLQCSQASATVACGLNSYGTQAQLPLSMWNLPGPGIKPMSPALAGRFLTTGPRGKFCISKYLMRDALQYLSLFPIFLSLLLNSSHSELSASGIHRKMFISPQAALRQALRRTPPRITAQRMQVSQPGTHQQKAFLRR